MSSTLNWPLAWTGLLFLQDGKEFILPSPGQYIGCATMIFLDRSRAKLQVVWTGVDLSSNPPHSSPKRSPMLALHPAKFSHSADLCRFNYPRLLILAYPTFVTFASTNPWTTRNSVCFGNFDKDDNRETAVSSKLSVSHYSGRTTRWARRSLFDSPTQISFKSLVENGREYRSKYALSADYFIFLNHYNNFVSATGFSKRKICRQ